jgi:hypothetical protein
MEYKNIFIILILILILIISLFKEEYVNFVYDIFKVLQCDCGIYC